MKVKVMGKKFECRKDIHYKTQTGTSCEKCNSNAFRLGIKPASSGLLDQCHRIDTQPEVRLRVGAFDVRVLVFSTADIFLASVHGKCLRYTEDVDVVFTKKNSSLLTLERGRWIRMLCDSSNLHKQKLVEPKSLASKMAAVKKVGQKNGEVGLLVEYLFCASALPLSYRSRCRQLGRKFSIYIY